jgi:hypothetical protein
MRTAIRLTVTVLMVTLLGCSRGEQPQPKPGGQPAATGKGETQWQEFTHEQGRFAVKMPGTPKEQVKEQATPKGNLKVVVNGVNLPAEGKSYVVTFMDNPAGPKDPDAAVAHEKFLDPLAAGIAKGLKGVPRVQARIKLDGHHGQELWIEIPEGDRHTLCRIYLVGNRLYQLFANWQGEGGEADAEKFVNSFKLK